MTSDTKNDLLKIIKSFLTDVKDIQDDGDILPDIEETLEPIMDDLRDLKDAVQYADVEDD